MKAGHSVAIAVQIVPLKLVTVKRLCLLLLLPISVWEPPPDARHIIHVIRFPVASQLSSTTQNSLEFEKIHSPAPNAYTLSVL